MSTTVLFDKRLGGSERLMKGKSERNFKGMLMAGFKKSKSILVRAKSMKKQERHGEVNNNKATEAENKIIGEINTTAKTRVY